LPTSKSCWMCCTRLTDAGNTVIVIEHNWMYQDRRLAH
jgi:excinuclease UvrABC ATPase subunit